MLKEKVIKEFRGNFRATYITRSMINEYYSGSKDLVLIKNIKSLDRDVLIEESWTTFTKALDKLMIEEGDEIEFTATLKPFIHNEKANRYEEQKITIKYNFINLRNISVVKKNGGIN